MFVLLRMLGYSVLFRVSACVVAVVAVVEGNSAWQLPFAVETVLVRFFRVVNAVQLQHRV